MKMLDETEFIHILPKPKVSPHVGGSVGSTDAIFTVDMYSSAVIVDAVPGTLYATANLPYEPVGAK